MYMSPVQIKLFQTIEDNNTGTYCPFSFMPLHFLRKVGYEQPPASYYRCVYDNAVVIDDTSSEHTILEELFQKFNAPDRPGTRKFRSMSVSDIIGLQKADKTMSYWYCNTIGFQPVNFDAAGVSP